MLLRHRKASGAGVAGQRHGEDKDKAHLETAEHQAGGEAGHMIGGLHQQETKPLMSHF